MRLNLILLIFFISGKIFAQDCQLENNSFQVGERVDYTIYYHLAGLWVSAGEVFFEIDSQKIGKQNYFHFNSVGKTLKKYDWIYEVRDHYESWVNVASFQPLRFKRSVNEGGTFIREDYIFKNKDKKVVTLRQMSEKEDPVKDTVDLKPCSFDVMTMIYHARNIDFSKAEVNDKIPINIFLDNESHESYLRYLGKKEIKVKGLGKFRCILFSPLLIEGTIFNGGEEMTVWVSDDKNRVPLYIETPILVGSIRARVNKMEGLRYPMEALVEED